MRSCSVRDGELLVLGGPVPQALEHPRREARVDQRLAGRDPAYRVHEVVAADLLEEVPRGARQDRREQGLVVVVAGQDQDLDARVDRPHVPADVDAAAVGQAGVQHGDVGPQGRDA